MPGLTSSLILVLPLPLLLVGLVARSREDRHARTIKTWAQVAAWFALGGSVFAAGSYCLGVTRSQTYAAIHLPARLGLLAISIDVDSLTVFMLVLVALVGLVVIRYSSPYLKGDVHEGRFHGGLTLTLGSFLLLISSGNIWEFLILWVVTSLFLHELLAFYRNRPVAVLAARKHYLLQRVADASLLTAFVLIVGTLHTSQFSDIMAALRGIPGYASVSLQIASGLLVMGAVLKSAQFPFHGWLIQVMEAPTPVSALLHAGIIYTGAFLLLRLVPIVSRVAWTGDTLIVVGLVSISTASLMMMTTTNIKGSLAYSTCGQIGFLLMECGLGLYSLVLLHIAAHAVYKAHAFLSSGSVVEYFRGPALPLPMPLSVSIWKTLESLAMASTIVVGTALMFGISLVKQAPVAVMGIILTVAISQLVLHALNMREPSIGGFLWIVVGISASISIVYFALEVLFAKLFRPMWLTVQGAGPTHDALLGLIVAVFVGLLIVQQRLPQILRHPFWQSIYVHLFNDLYVDMLLTRIVRRRSGLTTDPLHSLTQDHLREEIS